MLSCVLALQANAQITVTDMDENPGLTAQNLANALAGPGVSIVANSAQLVQTADPFGSPVEPPLSAAGTFTVANSVLGTGFSGGVILSTGRADNVEGSEDALSIEGNYNELPGILAQLGLLGDADLELLYGESDFFDATSLEFDFEPDADYVSIQFIFASEEYTEFVEDGFNDTFAIFVNGQTVNLATVEPHDDPVSVDTINLEENRLLYRNNDIHDSPVALDGFYVTEADGFTTIITCILPVEANEENSLKIVISDAGDDILDSWALLKGASLTTVKPLIVTKEAENPEALVENEYMNYFIHLTNTGSSAATVYEIHDLLPAGFQYQTMSTTGFTTDEPVISYISDGSDTHELLVWEGPYTVPANTTVTLSFPAHVGYELGTFYNGATAVANVPVIPSGDTAPVEVKEAVDIEVRDPANNNLVDGSAYIDFGGWISGSSQIPRTFTIRNNGITTNLTGISVTATGTNSADFIVDTTGMSTTLAPGASTTFTVRFKPSATGGRYANLEIESDDPDEDPFDISLYGYGSTALTMAQEAYAKASNTGASNYFGESVAVWGDRVVVGAYGESTNGATPPSSSYLSGAAYVFKRNPANGTWAQEAYLKASNFSTGDWFGYSVSIHEDTIVVGAPENESVYVFTRSGSTWSEQAILQAPFSESGDQFGASVDIDGNTIAVGTPGDDSGYAGDEEDITEPEAGAIHVFTRSGTTWSRQAYLKSNTPYSWDLFGYDVAIHGDTVVAGAIGWSGWTGYAEIHGRSGATWSRQAVLAPSHLDYEDSFGESVDVWGDSVIIGAPGDDSYSVTGSTIYTDNDATTVNWGAAYVYKRTGSSWAHQAFLKPSTYPIDQVWFGSDVSIAGDVAVVGAWGDWGDGTGIDSPKEWLGAQDAGAAYVFTRNGTNWSEKAFVKASNTAAGDRFSGVAIHGETVAVGAAWEDSNATGINGNQSNNSSSGSGAAYFFELFD